MKQSPAVLVSLDCENPAIQSVYVERNMLKNMF